jgi:hypothetical protein
MQWKPISDDMPRTAVLLWSAGYCMVGCLVGDAGELPAFMDPRNDSLLPWPSHWMELPLAPLPSHADSLPPP